MLVEGERETIWDGMEVSDPETRGSSNLLPVPSENDAYPVNLLLHSLDHFMILRFLDMFCNLATGAKVKDKKDSIVILY